MARIDPYNALIYQNICHMIEKPDDTKRNVEYVVKRIKGLVGSRDFPMMKGGAEIPVRLIAIPEAFCSGFADEYLGLDSLYIYNTTVPGPETDMLSEAAIHTGAYIMAIMQAKEPELMDDRTFNIGFIINPEGKIILKHHKTSMYFRERGTTPTDIWDRYIEKYGNDPMALMNAVYPVAKTDIGNLAVTICGEGEKPELYRALALNGAEVVCRNGYPSALNEQFELQNRAHAHFNNFYVIGVSAVVLYAPGDTTPVPGTGAMGHIVNYRGSVIARTPVSGPPETYTFATINVEELRYARVNSLWQHWLPQLRMEQYVLPYQYALQLGGLYPKNLAMDEPPMGPREHDDVIRWCINRVVELGIWTPPDGWKPFEIPKNIKEKIEKARSRPAPIPNSRNCI